jgi:uncharacterized protein YsxB (DUF464 family)
MIRFKEYEDNKYKYISIEGHADYSDGFDKVCGMVSVLAQTALYGVAKYSQALDVEVGSGLLKFKCRKNDMVGVPIMNSCIEGINQVRGQFPQCFEVI